MCRCADASTSQYACQNPIANLHNRCCFKNHGAKNITISNSSGTGETLGCSTNAMNVPYRPETVGQLVVGPEYVILNPDTLKEVKYGETGILCTRGKHVFKGYYGNPELTEEIMIDYKGKRYYATGNIGYLDKDRYFTLIGRASRFFIINTLNKVYCELVQSVVSNIDVDYEYSEMFGIDEFLNRYNNKKEINNEYSTQRKKSIRRKL